MGLLTCTKCKQSKEGDLAHFPPNSRKKNGLDSWCRECRSAYRKATRVPPGVIDMERALAARHVTECVICGETQKKQLAIDHDHASGWVRGALCNRCNLGLGHFRDNPKLLRYAALYLEGKCECGECKPYWGGASAS
jgi:hypothetical protein